MGLSCRAAGEKSVKSGWRELGLEGEARPELEGDDLSSWEFAFYCDSWVGS